MVSSSIRRARVPYRHSQSGVEADIDGILGEDVHRQVLHVVSAHAERRAERAVAAADAQLQDATLGACCCVRGGTADAYCARLERAGQEEAAIASEMSVTASVPEPIGRCDVFAGCAVREEGLRHG